MEVLVLLKGDRRAQFGGQDHLSSGCDLTGPLAHGRRRAGSAGRGGGCCESAGGCTGSLLLQTFLSKHFRHLENSTSN